MPIILRRNTVRAVFSNIVVTMGISEMHKEMKLLLVREVQIDIEQKTKT